MKNHLFLFLKGLAMGAANVIPGVSGGTIALITGIYEKLIGSVKAVDLSALRILLKGDIKGFWEQINGTFLTIVFLGIGVSLFTLAKLFKWMIEDPQMAIWLMAFFFGLIVVSIYSVGRTVEKWSLGPILALVIGLALAVFIALQNPAAENSNFLYLLVCGVIAMCSMILPGLSGSFVLILMGNYKLIMLDAVSELNVGILLPVAIGAVVGLIIFARLLAWVFKHYRDITIALMTGFIGGSLLTIWPWKNEQYALDAAGEILLKKGKPLVSGYEWFTPDMAASATWIAIVLMIVGGIAILLLERSAGSET